MAASAAARAFAVSASIRERGEIAVPAGDRRSSFLDVKDVGRAAATVLADPAAHAGRGYDLTGPEALSFADVADASTRVLGRPVRFRPVSPPRFVAGQVRSGRPLTISLVMTALHMVQRLGKAAPVPPGFVRLTGEPSGTLERHLRRGRATFGG